jgi:hypothetical protein
MVVMQTQLLKSAHADLEAAIKKIKEAEKRSSKQSVKYKTRKTEKKNATSTKIQRNAMDVENLRYCKTRKDGAMRKDMLENFYKSFPRQTVGQFGESIKRLIKSKKIDKIKVDSGTQRFEELLKRLDKHATNLAKEKGHINEFRAN